MPPRTIEQVNAELEQAIQENDKDMIWALEKELKSMLVEDIELSDLRTLCDAYRDNRAVVLPVAPGDYCKWEIIDGVTVDVVIDGITAYENLKLIEMRVIDLETGEVFLHTRITESRAKEKLTREAAKGEKQ